MKVPSTSYVASLSERPRATKAALMLAVAVAIGALSIVLGSGVGAAHAAETSSTGGHVWAWGYNGEGQLGDGYTVDRRTIVPVKGLSGVTDVEGGADFSLALKANGTVWGWGSNYHGQLGDWPTDYRTTPVRVGGISPLSGVVEVSGGGEHSLALKEDGTVRAWGSNDRGQLGDGTTTDYSIIPVQVSGLSDVVEVEAGGSYSGARSGSHSLALKDDGTVWAWGSNYDGQLGYDPDPTTTTPYEYSSTPGQVSGLSGVTEVAAGASHSLALKNDGTVWAWGDNRIGQLGVGTYGSAYPTPVQVSGLSGVTEVAAGANNSLALKDDGTVWTTTGWAASTFVQVKDLSGVTEVAVGGSHNLALKDNGTVWAWGWNYEGQLGNDTAPIGYGYHYLRTPVKVSGLSGVTDVAAGWDHSLAASTMPLDTPLPINYVYCKQGQKVCTGTERKDDIYGTRYQDTIRAGSGEDRIYALRANDVAYGGDDHDEIYGSYGNDRLYGGNGRDDIYTGGLDRDRDYVNCGAGRDKVYREKRIDTVENCEVVENLGGGGGGY